MKKKYIKPQSECINLFAEGSMMMTISGGQHTGGFGSKTQSTSDSFIDMPWMETEEDDVEA